jgi:hypothetical protein
MLPCGKINWEGKFAANCNHTPRDVSAGDRAQVPGLYEQKDGFEGNMSGFTFICHDTQSCVKVAVEALDDDWNVVVANENMTINL